MTTSPVICSNLAVDSLKSCPSLHVDGTMITKRDTVLIGHVQLSLPDVSFMQCSLRCQRQDWCISSNFQISQNTGKCELNNFGVKHEMLTEGKEFEMRKGFVYTQLRPAAVSLLKSVPPNLLNTLF